MHERQSRSTGAGVRTLIAALLMVAGVLALSTNTFAVPITSVTPGLTASGNVEFVIAPLVPRPFSDGNVTQAGEIRTTEGGVTTISGFTTAPGTADGVDDGTTVAPGTNPLPGTLTDTGDGFGTSTDLDALFATGFNFNEGYDFVVDITLDLANISAGDTYKATVNVDYSNVVDAGAVDSFAESKLDVELDNVDVLVSDVLSDGLFGDELNGTALGTNGATVSDIGVFSFDVTLAAGATGQVTAAWIWEGGVFAAADNSNTDFSIDITIADVMCQSGPGCVAPPQPLPVPSTFVLFGVGLLSLMVTATWGRRTHRERTTT